jgi:outer membrane lipoprotein-sorting protein
VVVVALACSACAPSALKLPAGPGAPAADAREAMAEATNPCQRAQTLSAEVAVSGSVGGERLRGRMLVGVSRSAPPSARLEAVAPFGAPVFIFVARGNDATLLLPRDERVLEHGRPEAVLEAVAGVPLDPTGLRATLTGCAIAADVEEGRAIGDDWRVVPDGPGEDYLHRDPHAAPWRLVAASRPDWRAEYRDFQDGLPHTIRLISADPKRFDLRLSLSQVEINPTFGRDVFSVQIPRSATPITIDELRHARPGLRKN